MAGKTRWLTLKSRKVRFCVRDPCADYPAWMRDKCWNEHEPDNLEQALRKERKNREESRSGGA